MTDQKECHKHRNDPCACSRKALLCDGFGPPQQAEPVEPVAWMLPGSDSIITAETKAYRGMLAENWTLPLYTAPPRCPNCAALAQQDEPNAHGYASRLAVAIWDKHYKDTAPQWKPLDDLMGVLTQIDNMTSGLTRLAQQAEPVQEPVATVVARQYDDGTYAGNALDWAGRNCENDFPVGTKLYTAPPQRKLVPLTEEEIDKIFKHLCDTVGASCKTMARAVEKTSWEKNHGQA